VETLQTELGVKDAQLKTKDEEANKKLRQMIADQQQAEAKKLRSIQIQQQLEDQQAMIAERKEGVLSELEEVEPMVQEAAGAVANIKKAHLAEVRAMGNPPETVKLAVESACIVLGFKVDGWKAVQSVIRRDDFTSMVRNFDSEKISPATRNKIERDYMALPNFNVDAADRASKACGPLVQWVFAQVRYSAILDKVGPLRDEVIFLEHQAETTMEQAKIALETVQQLEESIARYKDEYAQLISETQTIKLEMRQVQDKVTRSTSLLSSLSSEQERWSQDSEQFENEIANVPGDVLQSSVLLTYAGWFDQHSRLRLLDYCRTQMTTRGIAHRSRLSFLDFLSSVDEISEWSNAGLAVDDLTVENALILKRFNRYPLIIDPTDQATAFLTGSYGKGKMIVTSFLDSAFIKNLETALRFGNALLIQNAEVLNPVLTAVLNKEIRKTGGRNLVRLGNQDVDFSPSFVMFLSTRDAALEVGPDVSSRTTIVNFSMTPSSLFSQSLDKILKAESPEVYRKRKDLQKIQSGYRVKLRHLEESLLRVLNECNGNILEDDKVIATLETVKKEAANVGQKVAEAETAMDVIEEKAKEYNSIARAASDIFFLLARLSKLHHFYRFSLDFFLHIFDTVLLNNPRLLQMQDPKRRQQVILEDLFIVAMSRVQQGLLHQDYAVLSAFMASIYLSACGEADKARALLRFIQRNGDDVRLDDDAPDRASKRAFERLPFGDLGIDDANAKEQIQNASVGWQDWLESATPELQPFGQDLDGEQRLSPLPSDPC
jgi:dynein heavy chain 1